MAGVTGDCIAVMGHFAGSSGGRVEKDANQTGHATEC